MPIADDRRGAAMGRRVRRTARAAGVDEDGLSLIQRCHDVARAWREARLDDDHDPHYLHPGRTALILMLDTSETDPVVLAAALLAESHRPELRAPDERITADGEAGERSALDRVLETRSRIPSADAVDRVERLVTAPDAVLRIAVAERLDHARHAHMWLEGREDRAFLREAEELWIALAERAHPRLAQRYRRWARGARARTGR